MRTLLSLIFIVLVAGGWIGNIVKLCQADFEAPYKTELIRVGSIFIAPVGVVIGWMDIGEENEPKILEAKTKLKVKGHPERKG